MSSNWSHLPLGEVITLQRGFDLPTQDRRNGEVPIISSSGISGVHDEAKASPPGVVTGRYGTIGQVHFVDRPFWPLNTTLFVKDFKGNDERFVYYLLQTLDYESLNDKSSVPGVNRNHLHQLTVELPPLAEQRAIAHILGTLDDKIELNRRMNETLEGIARALFKSWFVDFDPVRAKAEGREPYGMDAETAALFPDSFEDSELGPIPRGWQVVSLGEQFEVVKGVSYKGSGLSDHGMPLHNLNSIYEGGGYKYDGIKYYNGEFADRHAVKPGNVIVANTEQGHDRLLIGYAAIIPKAYGDFGIVSHHIFRMRPKPSSHLTARYLCRLLNSHQMHGIVSGYANGTTVNMLPMDGLTMPQFVVPPRNLAHLFDGLTKHTANLQGEKIAESQALGVVRDTLIPKLFAGDWPAQTLGET